MQINDIFYKFDKTDNDFDITLILKHMIDICVHYSLPIVFLIARYFDKLLICLTLFFLCLAKAPAPPTEKGPASRVSASVVKKIRDIGTLSGASEGLTDVHQSKHFISILLEKYDAYLTLKHPISLNGSSRIHPAS